MRILIGCEESQRMCSAFRAKGHEAYSCDVQCCSGDHPEWHILQDVLEILGGGIAHLQNGETVTIPGWDMIIAHPPCTFMSNAGACRMYPRKGQIDPERFAKAMEAKEFFMKILNADCEKICVENPRPMKCIGLPHESQRIQPYQFGEPWSKETYLWLKGLPPLMATEVLAEYKPYVSCGTSRNKGRKDKSGMSRAGGAQKIRSKSFEGICKAMAAQWC